MGILLTVGTVWSSIITDPPRISCTADYKDAMGRPQRICFEGDPSYLISRNGERFWVPVPKGLTLPQPKYPDKIVFETRRYLFGGVPSTCAGNWTYKAIYDQTKGTSRAVYESPKIYRLMLQIRGASYWDWPEGQEVWSGDNLMEESLSEIWSSIIANYYQKSDVYARAWLESSTGEGHPWTQFRLPFSLPRS